MRVFLALCLFSCPAFCAASRPPETQTFWDRLMEQQSVRNMARGVNLLDSGQYSDAAREFGKAAVENPQDAWPHVLLGSALYWSGEVDQALTEYETALKLDPANSDAYQLIGIAQAWKGDVEAALSAFSSAAKFAPERADVQMNLGSVYESLGDYAAALEHFRQAVYLSPESPLYAFQLASLYSRGGRDEDAAGFFEKAIDLYPGYEDAMVELAALCERSGDLKKARQNYKKAVNLKPGDSVARLRYALLLSRIGEKAEAASVLSRAFLLTPEKKGEGIALSVSYAGGSQAPSSDGGKTSSGPLDSLRKNLERIPLDQEAKVSVEMIYLQKPKLEPLPQTDSGSMKQAMASAMNQSPRALGAKKDFVLPPSDSSSRASKIDSFMRELAASLAQAPKDSETRMALSVVSEKPGGNKTQIPSAKNDSANVAFNPRDVGNDMGLWLIGTSWIELVNEAADSLDEPPGPGSDGAKWAAAGLARVILGEPKAALEKFGSAIERGAKETGYLGSAIAWIELGDEEKAIDCCRKALEANPKSEAAKQNLKWLKTPSSLTR